MKRSGQQEDLERVLVDGTEEELLDFVGNCTDDSPCIFFVDWREDDEAIIGYVAERLPAEALTYKASDDQTEFSLRYRGQSDVVKLTLSPRNRMITVAGINRAIASDYEIRSVAAYQADTYCLCLMPVSWWSRMDREHPDLMAARFMKIDDLMRNETAREAATSSTAPTASALSPPRKPTMRRQGKKRGDLKVIIAVIAIAFLGICWAGLTSEAYPLLIAIVAGFVVVPLLNWLDKRRT